MKIGDKVYVVNAKTNKVDEWIFDGYVIMPKEPFCRLLNGDKFCALPKRCVFENKAQAKKVLRLKN